MSKRQILILIAVFNSVFLFLGLPSSWDKIVAIVISGSIIVLAYRLNIHIDTEEGPPESFTEHKSKSDPSTTAPNSSMSDIKNHQS